MNPVSLREMKSLRGAAEANPELPRFARNRLRNLSFWDCHVVLNAFRTPCNDRKERTSLNIYQKILVERLRNEKDIYKCYNR